jgi:hypothetical protein
MSPEYPYQYLTKILPKFFLQTRNIYNVDATVYNKMLENQIQPHRVYPRMQKSL